MSTIKTAITKSFHFSMKNDFTSGKEKKRKALRCVFIRIVSQSIDCRIFHHYGNGKPNILQHWKARSYLKEASLCIIIKKARTLICCSNNIDEDLFLKVCTLLNEQLQPLTRESTIVVRCFRFFRAWIFLLIFFWQLFENSTGTKPILARFFLYIFCILWNIRHLIDRKGAKPKLRQPKWSSDL